MATPLQRIPPPLNTITVSKDIVEELPLIQEVVTEREQVEEFHDTCKNLIIDTGIEISGEEQSTRVSPRSDSWAEEVLTLLSRDEATCDLILEAGVIHFDKKPVVLRPWSTEIYSTRMVNSVPVWVRLNGLGLQYWGKNNLSALVSTIGKPAMIDNVTQERSMVKFSRVLVEIEISDDPPKTISFINERKQLVEQSVEYEWLPTKCSACANLGHTIANCNKEKKIIWKKKQSVEKEKVLDKQKDDINQDKDSGEMADLRRVVNDSRLD
uniref:DUF4283 domain-containing protein n=1 Tax=Cannabis sativa TaxID=3483 RepID=A0A803Q1Q9_CANSA